MYAYTLKKSAINVEFATSRLICENKTKLIRLLYGIPLLGSNQFGFKGKIDCYSASKSLSDFLIAYTFFPCLPTYFPL